MKKLNKLLAFFLVLALISCESDDTPTPAQNLKLLKKITYPNGDITSFTYNEDNTLNQVQDKSKSSEAFYTTYFIYENGLPQSSKSYDFLNRLDFEEQYSYSNGQLIEIQAQNHNPDIIAAEPNNFVIQFSYTNNNITTIEYQGAGATFKELLTYDQIGNLTSINRDYTTESISDQEFRYTYDDKNSPFKNLNPILFESKWLDFELKSNINNPATSILTLLSQNTEIKRSYTYIYDADNFPVRREETSPFGVIQLSYEYY